VFIAVSLTEKRPARGQRPPGLGQTRNYASRCAAHRAL